jgi:hypothetical protein
MYDQLGYKRSWSTFLFHLNIRSLKKNYTNLKICLDSIDNKFNIIALSETWLKDYSADLYTLDGYHHEHLTRDNSAGGGVSLYLQDSLMYKVRSDLNYHDISLDMLWVEIEKFTYNAQKHCHWCHLQSSWM